MHGILVIDKPEGITSAAVVRRVKRTLGGKVGHLGTLDPFASGVLPLCLGEGTKIAQFLSAADKSYEGVIRLGVLTDTGDRTGVETQRRAVPVLTPAQCSAVAAGFIGSRLQTPPMYSAVKKQGVPLHKLARRGEEVEREPRTVRIDALTLESLAAVNGLAFSLRCSKGTYVRVLAQEIGEAFGTVAHLDSLRRTRFGQFGLQQALTLPLDVEQAQGATVSPRAALEGMAEFAVDPPTAARVRRGEMTVLHRLQRPRTQPATAKLVGPDGTLLAVVVADALGRWQFARVLNPAAGPGDGRQR